MNEDRRKKLDIARRAIDLKQYKEAWQLLDSILQINPNDVGALITATRLHVQTQQLTVAYQFASRAKYLNPGVAAVWTNYGHACERLYQLEDAEQAYMRAVELSKDQEALIHNYNNYAGLMSLMGRYALGEEAARKVLRLNPDHRKARGNLGLSLLAQRKWEGAWELYGATVGTEQRRLMKYAEENEWDGSKDKTVIVYGEQGLGDELSFASMVPDAIRDCKRVIIDCDPRLSGLFKRSFPQATVYGTRGLKDVLWADGDETSDYSISIGQLGKIYRLKDSDFPGTPYLIPDPVRTGMWKSYFATLKKPVIGIAWSGGLQWTAAQFRRWTLPQIEPLIRSAQAHWVSLQWQDAQKEIDASGLPIHQYPYATLTKDYDDTAALVAACDLVICMQTSVGHLAAALGKETWVFVNKLSQWRYAGDTEDILWYKSMKLFRANDQNEWPLEKAGQLLMLRYGNRELRREHEKQLRRA